MSCNAVEALKGQVQALQFTSEKMEALLFTLKEKKLEHVMLPVPKVVNPDDILVKVAYAGVCGTDIHIIHGEFPCNPHRPITMGHELCGTIVDVGTEVTVLKKGDRVVVDPNRGCLICDPCRSGNPHFCPTGGIDNYLGIHRDGGWAEYLLTPLGQVHKIPDGLSMEEAALTEPMSVISHGWDLISPVTLGAKILIIGAGIIGNLWASLMHLQGHKNVTISEPKEARLDLLRSLNTGYTLITPDELKRNQQADPGYLFDIIIECSGCPQAVEHSTTLLARGGKLCVFGCAPQHEKILISPFEIYLKEMKIYGVLINPFSFEKSLAILQAMGDRYLIFEKLGIKTFKLKEYEQAVEMLGQGTIAKAMFKM